MHKYFIFLSYLVFVTIFIFSSKGFTQTKTSFDLLEDDSISKKRYEQELNNYEQQLLKNIDRTYIKDYEKIYKEHFSFVREVLNSSSTITAKKADNYLQSVVQKIINGNTPLQHKQIRVFFSRNWIPNAYSMGDGSIAINIGLVKDLNNEAELAFVICHELAHFYLQHSDLAIKKYVETINNKSYQTELKKLAKQEFGVNKQLDELQKNIIFDNKRHSRQNEVEADKWALHFLKNTGYNTEAVISCLQILNKIDENIEAKTVAIDSIFNFENYRFKKSWIYVETSIFSKMNPDDNITLTQAERDSLKTHPDCLKRIVLIKDSIDNARKNFFLVSDSLFTHLQFCFEKEIVEDDFLKKQYTRNLFHALYLLQNNKHKNYAIFAIARCLNAIYTAQKAHTLGLYIDKENKVFSNSYNRLLRMIDKLKLYEVAALNYHFCEQYKSTMQHIPAFVQEYNTAQLNYKSSQ